MPGGCSHVPAADLSYGLFFSPWSEEALRRTGASHEPRQALFGEHHSSWACSTRQSSVVLPGGCSPPASSRNGDEKLRRKKNKEKNSFTLCAESALWHKEEMPLPSTVRFLLATCAVLQLRLGAAGAAGQDAVQAESTGLDVWWWQWECRTVLATSTAEGLGLTGEAALAQCCALCVAVSPLLPFLRHGGQAGEGWTCAVGVVGAGRTPPMAAGMAGMGTAPLLPAAPAAAWRFSSAVRRLQQIGYVLDSLKLQSLMGRRPKQSNPPRQTKQSPPSLLLETNNLPRFWCWERPGAAAST